MASTTLVVAAFVEPLRIAGGKSIRWLYVDPDGSLSKSILRSAGLLKAIPFPIHFPGGCFDNLNDSVKDSIGISLSLMLVCRVWWMTTPADHPLFNVICRRRSEGIGCQWSILDQCECHKPFSS